VTVIHRKVANDHGHWQGDREDTGQCAERADEHADVRFRHHVPVTDGGHGHQGPPQTQRYALEVVLRIVLGALRVVDETGEDDDAENEEEDQQRELLRRGAEGLYQDLQARRVTRELEQPHYAYDAQELEDVGVLQVGREPLQRQIDVEAQGRHHVDQVHRALDEVAAIRTRGDPCQELEGEPCVAHAFDVKEDVVGVGAALVQHPGCYIVNLYRTIRDYRHSHVRMGFQAKGEYRNADEENGDYADYLKDPDKFQSRRGL